MNGRLTDSRIFKDILKLSKDIRRKHKQIRQLHQLSIEYNHVWASPESSAKYEFLFQHVKLKSLIDTSVLRVPSSVIIKEIHKHPTAFADVVANSYNQTSFNVLINHTVPAAFGFFSCAEMLDVATAFYCRIVDCCSDVRLMRRIVSPLLVSLATFRFCESVFDSLFRKLGTSQKANEELLAQVVIQYLPLLPTQIICVLRKIVENKRTSFYFSEVFFGAFMNQCAELCLPSCPYFNNAETVTKVMKGIVKNGKCINQLKQAIYMVRSRYSLPALISFPDRPLLKIHLSMADIRNLAVMLSVMKQFPSDLNLAQFTKIREAWEPCLLTISLWFQSDSVADKGKHSYSLFETSQDVFDEELFERLAQGEILSSEMDEHLALANDYQELVIGRCLAKSIEEAAKKPLEYIIEKTETIPRLRRKVILKSVWQRQVEEKWKRMMGRVDKEWMKVVAKMSKENTKKITPKLGPNCKSILNRIIHDLSQLDKVFLCDRLTILLSVFGTVEIMKTFEHLTDALYLCVFENALCKKLLSSVIQINAFGMWDRRFARQCSESESHVWLRLESSILSALSQDKDTLDLYTKSQERLGIESHMGTAQKDV